MGGFESSTHRDKSGRRLDLIASTRHDEFAEKDYARLMELGLRGCRDAVRWHLIEREPFKYDFSSLKNQVEASRKTGIEVTWDYFHYGYPDDLDIFKIPKTEETFYPTWKSGRPFHCESAVSSHRSKLDWPSTQCDAQTVKKRHLRRFDFSSRNFVPEKFCSIDFRKFLQFA